MKFDTVYSSMIKRANAVGMTKEALNVGKALDVAGDVARRTGDNIGGFFRRVFPKKVPATNPDKLVQDAYNATKDVRYAPKTNAVGVPTEVGIVNNYNTRQVPDIRAMAEKLGEPLGTVQRAEDVAKARALNPENWLPDDVSPSLSDFVDSAYRDYAPRYRAFMEKAEDLVSNEQALQNAIRNRNKPFSRNSTHLNPELKAKAKATGTYAPKTPQQIQQERQLAVRQQIDSMRKQQMDYLNNHKGKAMWEDRVRNGVKPQDYILNPEGPYERDFRKKLWGTNKLIDQMEEASRHPVDIRALMASGALK